MLFVKQATMNKKKENYLVFHDMNAIARVRMLFLLNVFCKNKKRKNSFKRK